MYSAIINEIWQEDYTVENVSEAAEKILSIKQASKPIEIIEICNNMGFSVFRQDMPSAVCGYIAIDGELKERFGTDRIISVNKSESSKRRRFTVAHEIGHFLFDFDPNSSIQFYNAFEMDDFEALEKMDSEECTDRAGARINNDEEVEISAESEKRANRFAAELLMPKNIFISDYNTVWKKYEGSSGQFYKTVQELSDLFLVPPKAVEKRIKEELRLYAG